MIGIGLGGPRKGFHAVALSEILVAFQRIDEILLAPVHLRCSYGAGDLRFGERFRDMVRMDGPNSICLDFSRFDETEPLNQPLNQPLRPGAPGHGA